VNTEKFVEAVRSHVQEQAENTVVKTITSPPGKRPRELLVKAAEWRSRMTNDEKILLDGIIYESVRVAIFGLFSVVDGVRVVDESIDRFIITAVQHDGVRVEINADPSVELHSEFSPN